jgi:dephospho-CoA kinase
VNGLLGYGLTGGIGSGKSTVGKMFAEEGWQVFDADLLGHQALTEAGVKEEIRRIFPECFLEGVVDRRRLAARVFADPAERRRLEELLHPRILERICLATRRAARPWLLEGAVLMESPLPFRRLLAGIIVVSAPWRLRLRRVMERDGCSEGEALARGRSQLPQDEKILQTDFFIENGGDLEHTRRQVRAVSQMLAREWGELK